MVDEFRINYSYRNNAEQIINALKAKYEVTQDCTGTLYCGITLKWNYTVKILDISIPGYVTDALHKLQNPIPSRPHNYPHQCSPPNYVSTTP